MFDEVLKMVKDQLSNNPQISSAIPPEKQDAVHHEVASQVTNGIKSQAAALGGAGGLLSMLEQGIASGSPIVNAIEGGVVGSLGNKFGLSPMVTGAIAAALPGILQKFVHKAKDPNDPSITPESINQSLPSANAPGLGNLMSKFQ